jgi:thiamine biosynthesis lipoprotein
MMLDFGGIAKGWAGDRAAQILRGAGVTSAILRLGGNIHTIGTKPDGSAWRVGIEDPASGGTLAVLSVADLAVVTSGSYQRNFTQNGQFYHHIIDPATGSPVRNELTGVTVVGPYGARCDALSTALFVMGLEEAAQFWREYRDFEAVFVCGDGSVAITAGLEDSFALMDGYANREVHILS